jgi:hypothetical protein
VFIGTELNLVFIGTELKGNVEIFRFAIGFYL